MSGAAPEEPDITDEAEIEAGLAGVEVFDAPQALELMGGDRDILQEILIVYLEDFPVMLGEFKVALAAADTPGMMRQAHSIKGASANIAAGRVLFVAEAMERAAREGKIERCGRWLGALEREGRLLRERLITAGWTEDGADLT